MIVCLINNIFYLFKQVDYQSLINQRKYVEAANELQKLLESEPDDNKRGLLTMCLWLIDKAEDALQVAIQIESPTFRDYQIIADIHWQLNNWNEMIIALKSALSISQSAAVYYRLAIAEARGRNPHKIDAASKEIMQGYLSKATDFEDCPVQAYMFFAKLCEPEKSDNKLSILLKAIKKYPNDTDVRLELASILIYNKRLYEQAIELLTHLFGTIEYGGVARWHAFIALFRHKKYSEATQYLDKIPIKDKNKLAKIKADLLFMQGRLSEWLIYSDEYRDTNIPEDIVGKYFRKAYVNLQTNDFQQAINDFTLGANLMLETDIIPNIYFYLDINQKTFWYSEFDVITDVCETLVLLKSDTTFLSVHSTGLLAYTLYRYFPEEQHQELLALFPENSDSLLLLAAELLNFPPSLSKHLAWYFIDKDLLKAIHYYLSYSIWANDSDSDFIQNILNQFYGEKMQVNEICKKQIPLINEIITDYLKICKSDVIINVFLPLYDNFWRSVLFETKEYKIVNEVSKLLVDASDGSEALFDYAYSLRALGKQDEAQAAYIRLISQEPNNASALNNLGVIYESKAMLDEAFGLYSKASELFPSTQLYIDNRDKIQKKLEFRNKSLEHVQKTIEAIKGKAYNVGMSDHKLTEINLLYWESEIAIKQIQEQVNLRFYGCANLNKFIIPKSASERCPNCLIDLVYKSRSARNSDEKTCLGCGHQSRGWCRCDYCKLLEEERRQQAEKARRLAAIEEFRKLQEQYCNLDYVEWAVTKLSRRDKIFLKSYIEIVKSSDKPTWEDVCRRAGVVSQKTYVEKLQKLKLLLVNPNQNLIINSALQVSMLEVENVRKISPSLRFDIFQRDNHTCQYCGRTPPDVKLVIDHLIPVAKDGTDDFENLVTSCEECNSGKSAKLIKDFTGGRSKEEWSKQIRANRISVLRERCERLDEITQHWMESLKRRSLSEKDCTAIHNFVERYEPDWIIAAIGIAARKEIQHYVNYTGAILKNWAKDSPPEYLSNPDSGLAKKPATPKQITYIASLLEKAGLSLNEACDQADFDQLTMLDARNLISALTEEVDE